MRISDWSSDVCSSDLCSRNIGCCLMAGVGDRIEETGTLLRDGGGFVLHRDLGGRWRLNLQRTPVDHVAKHVRIVGIVVEDGLIVVEGISRTDRMSTRLNSSN